MSTPGQELVAASATLPARAAVASPQPGTASTSAGASDATLIRCRLRWRPTRRGLPPDARGGRLGLSLSSGATGKRLSSGAAGKRCGSPGLVAFSPLAEAGLRCGSGENGADSGL